MYFKCIYFNCNFHIITTIHGVLHYTVYCVVIDVSIMTEETVGDEGTNLDNIER